jgi:hypothetical protein
MMLHIHNMSSLVAASRLIPVDEFSGNGLVKNFALYNVTPEILARVYVDQLLKGTLTDFFTYQAGGTNWLSFYTAPGIGSNNIQVQTGTCFFFPEGTVLNGYINAYRGDSVYYPWYVMNDDAAKGYLDVTITPLDFITPNEVSWIKLAKTEAGLETAVAGAALTLDDMTDSDVAHIFWAKVTIPRHTLAANTPAVNKYDINFNMSWAEYDL